MTTDISTVMGPATLSSAPQRGLGNTYQAPHFITNETPKARYRDALRMWIQMLFMFSEVDSKSKAMLKGAGHLIYMACDDYAQQMLRSAEKSGTLSLKGEQNDPEKQLLVESIINVIAKESPTELVRLEVDLLTAIHNCKRNRKESPHSFANRFNGTVARYVNQTTKLTDLTSRQFAITMLRNATLNPVTLNALMFQLTSKADEANKGPKMLEYAINIENCAILTTFIDKANLKEGVNYDEIKAMSEQMKELITQSNSEHKITMFTMEDATQYLAQIKEVSEENIEPAAKSTMLGKRVMEPDPAARMERIKKMKEESVCKGCGKTGHWYKDYPECLEVVRNNNKQRYKDGNRRGYDTYRRDDDPKKKVTSFFRQGGQ